MRRRRIKEIQREREEREREEREKTESDKMIWKTKRIELMGIEACISIRIQINKPILSPIPISHG